MGRFIIRARLGAGGMGEVYRAEDTRLKRSVALKRVAPELKADEGYRQRLLREAQYASGLTNQHIAGVYDVLEENGEIFLVMEYVEGVTLRQRLSQPLSIEQLLGIAAQCATALAAAHERGIVHRDIKPENIMLTPAGEVKILDFGVAKRRAQAEGGTTSDTQGSGGGFSGTPAYMAPEVLLEKESDHRADIFSLGVVLYETLSGRHPFRAEGFLATSDRILHDIPAPLRRFNPKASPELERIVAKMLAKDPAERYATAADLLVDLRSVQRGVAYPAPQPAVPLPARRAIAKRWGWAGAIGIVLVGGLLSLPQVRQRLPWFRPAEAGPENLVVLPFQAIGEGRENQAYADGLTETLTAKLTQLTASHKLQVVPAREVRTRHVSNAETARRELGANFVLEGTLFRAENTVRVSYALVEAGTLHQLRADTTTAGAGNPFAMQDQVTDGVLRLLRLELNPQERRALEAHGTQVAGAYEFYLQGRGYLQNYDRPENIENAITVLQRALSFDPNYALAYAGLGDAYWKKYEGTTEKRWVIASREACERALTLDARLAAAHICLGTVDNGTGEYDKAITEFQSALEDEPTSDDAYRGLGMANERLGQLKEAERTYRRAIEVRPQYWAGYIWLGGFYYRQARYADAVEMYKQVVALAPDSWLGYSNLGAMYILHGRYEEAIPVLEQSIAIRPSTNAYSNLGTAYFFQGRFQDAARAYEERLKQDEKNYIVWGNLGDADYWVPGRRTEAMHAYQKAIELAQEKLQVNPRDSQVLAQQAYYYAMVGQRKPALAALQRALALAPDNPYLQFKAAEVHNRFGQAEQAIQWLEKALRGGYSASEVRNTPNFETLRSNPRFQELLQGK